MNHDRVSRCEVVCLCNSASVWGSEHSPTCAPPLHCLFRLRQWETDKNLWHWCAHDDLTPIQGGKSSWKWKVLKFSWRTPLSQTDASSSNSERKNWNWFFNCWECLCKSLIHTSSPCSVKRKIFYTTHMMFYPVEHIIWGKSKRMLMWFSLFRPGLESLKYPCNLVLLSLSESQVSSLKWE